MKLLVPQRKYKMMLPHESTLQGAFKWWLKRGNGECKHFCPSCPLYFRCQEYVVEKEIFQKRIGGI